jgi:hypothetical protein
MDSEASRPVLLGKSFRVLSQRLSSRMGDTRALTKQWFNHITLPVLEYIAPSFPPRLRPPAFNQGVRRGAPTLRIKPYCC